MADANEGRKDDKNKPRMDLVPPRALLAMGDVLAFGATKYSPENWRLVPQARRRYFAAAMRHLLAYATGEELDPESGLHHLAHAMCCVAFVLELEVEDAAAASTDCTVGGRSSTAVPVPCASSPSTPVPVR